MTSFSTWHALEEFYRQGRARSIGVSNFQVSHLRRLAQESEVVPTVNQIEVHPYLGNEEVRATNAELGIVTEPGHRSQKAGFSRIRRSEQSPADSAGRQRRSPSGGTLNAAT